MSSPFLDGADRGLYSLYFKSPCLKGEKFFDRISNQLQASLISPNRMMEMPRKPSNRSWMRVSRMDARVS